MSRVFYAINSEGERWKPNNYTDRCGHKVHEYLIMLDSGKLAVVTEDFYQYIKPLGPEWQIKFNDSMETLIERYK